MAISCNVTSLQVTWLHSYTVTWLHGCIVTMFWHIRSVNGGTITEFEVAPQASTVTEKFLRLWMDARDGFRAWERREILLSEPNPKILGEYREALKWMLRLTRLL